MGELTHFDGEGNAVMVDVSAKAITEREAAASGKIIICRDIYDRLAAHTVAKGDVLGVARIAAIMAAKKTSDLIPLCHPLPLSKVTVDFVLLEEAGKYAVEATCLVKTSGRTGVEMEALTGVSAALLTIYDMCKAIDKSMELTEIHLLRKSGGRSGDFTWKQQER